MDQENKKEPCRGMAQQIKNALTRSIYRNDEEKLKDAQAYIWISMIVIGISLIVFLLQIAQR